MGKNAPFEPDKVAAEYFFRQMENARKADLERFKSLYPPGNSLGHAQNTSAHQDFSDKRKFGWDEEYDLEILYRGINGPVILAQPFKQFHLNFIDVGEPDQKIICFNGKQFANLLCNLQKHDLIFSASSTASIILNRCRDVKNQLLDIRSINNYLSESEKIIPYPFVAKLIARITNKKMSSD